MIGFQLDDIHLLRCPACAKSLHWNGSDSDGQLINGTLECSLDHIWRVRAGIPNLADRGHLTTKERLLDVVYDLLAPVHDLSETYLLPALQYPDEKYPRSKYIEAMQLDTIGSGSNDQPVKILEIGAGTGANIPLFNQAIAGNLNAEVWAVDLNANMIDVLAKSNKHDLANPLRLALADAHILPFPDSSFERVIHVGGINIYRDIKQGLAEMARVAKPGTPIVVVDEGLDTNRENSLLHHLAFKMLTSLDEIKVPPVNLLPDNCELMNVFNVSRFYYCLVFRKIAN